MNRKLSTAILSLTVALLPFSALGADLGSKDSPSADVASPGRGVNWTGVYVGGQFGYGNSNHNLNAADTTDRGSCKVGTSSDSSKNEADCLKKTGGVWTSDVQTDASAFLDGLNSHGMFGGGTVGADIQRGNLLFGVFGDYNFSQAETQAGISVGGKSLGTASIEEDDSWVVAARAGYLFGSEKRALLYVLGGYGQSDVTYTVGDDSKDVTFSGFVAGGGGEYALTQNVFLGIEYQHFFGGEETLFSDDGKNRAGQVTNTRLTDEMDTDKVMAKLKIKLNGDLPNLGW